jgi:hypothetical protein
MQLRHFFMHELAKPRPPYFDGKYTLWQPSHVSYRASAAAESASPFRAWAAFIALTAASR